MLWWIQNGAPAYRLIKVNNRLEEIFRNRVIAVNHEEEWPPRPLDLTPCDFFLWVQIKIQVFLPQLQNLQELIDKILLDIERLQALSGILSGPWRLEHKKCLQRNGRHVQGMQTSFC